MPNNQESIKYKPVHRKSMDFARIYNFISPSDLEEILETLEDWDCLNSKGEKLRGHFWKEFITDQPTNKK